MIKRSKSPSTDLLGTQGGFGDWVGETWWDVKDWLAKVVEVLRLILQIYLAFFTDWWLILVFILSGSAADATPLLWKVGAPWWVWVPWGVISTGLFVGIPLRERYIVEKRSVFGRLSVIDAVSVFQRFTAQFSQSHREDPHDTEKDRV